MEDSYFIAAETQAWRQRHAPKKGNNLHRAPFPNRTRDGRLAMKFSFHTMAAGAVLSVGLALAACGTTPEDRAVSGGLLGAAGGAAIGSVAGNARAGGIIGRVRGAAVRALSDSCTLQLRDPVLRGHRR